MKVWKRWVEGREVVRECEVREGGTTSQRTAIKGSSRARREARRVLKRVPTRKEQLARVACATRSSRTLTTHLHTSLTLPSIHSSITFTFIHIARQVRVDVGLCIPRALRTWL